MRRLTTFLLALSTLAGSQWIPVSFSTRVSRANIHRPSCRTQNRTTRICENDTVVKAQVDLPAVMSSFLSVEPEVSLSFGLDFFAPSWAVPPQPSLRLAPARAPPFLHA